MNALPITAGQISGDLLRRVSQGFEWIFFTVHRVPAEHVSSMVFDAGADDYLNRRANLRLYETTSSHSEDYLLKLSF